MLHKDQFVLISDKAQESNEPENRSKTGISRDPDDRRADIPRHLINGSFCQALQATSYTPQYISRTLASVCIEKGESI